MTGIAEGIDEILGTGTLLSHECIHCPAAFLTTGIGLDVQVEAEGRGEVHVDVLFLQRVGIQLALVDGEELQTASLGAAGVHLILIEIDIGIVV